MTASDMPKLHSPFVRKDGIVTPQIEPGYEWVFEDPRVIATEKLHGTNVSVVKENKEVVAIYNRTNRIPFFQKGKGFIVQGVRESFDRGYLDDLPDGQHFGELIGPKLHGDPHQVGEHLWIPFNTYGRQKLAYKSWQSGQYPKTFEAISEWFEKSLVSLFWSRFHGEPPSPEHFCEGIVFVQPSTGKMAKIRRDMYSWFKGLRHKEEEEASTAV